MTLTLAIVLLLAGAALDVISTRAAKAADVPGDHRAIVEGGPVLRYVGAAWLPVRLALTAAAVAVVVWQPQWWWVGVAIALAWAVIAMRNFANAKKVAR